jgi:glycerate 2-kinase
VTTPRVIAEELVRAALSAADPEAAVRAALRLEGPVLRAGDACHDLRRVGRILVVGGGKAATAMACAVEDVLGARVSGGLVVAKAGCMPDRARPALIEVAEAGHPLPDSAGLAAAARLVDLLRGLTDEDLVIALLSGGGSSLLSLPVDGIGLADLEVLGSALLGAGAPIDEINTVRKHLGQLGGGQLALRAAPAAVLGLILSDVVGDRLDMVASGPTAADPTTFAEALEILERRRLVDGAPRAILEVLRAGRAGTRPETPKPGDARLARADNVLIGNNALAADAVRRRARELGLAAEVLASPLVGEARDVGRSLAVTLRALALHGQPLSRPACLIAGGETTVTLGLARGRGGRNQELALAAAIELQGTDDALLVALATDGNDGVTDAAGAIVDGTTVARGEAAGLDAWTHLLGHDAYPYFAALGDLLLLGPTGTNVNDLALLLAL